VADSLSKSNGEPSPVPQTGDRADQLPRSLHADKFRVVLAGLIGIALGALAVAAAVLVAHDNNSSTSSSSGASASGGMTWSSWKPNSTGNEGATEIADYIAPFYRLSTSQQLAVISPISTTQLNASTGTFTGSGLTVALNTSAGSTASESSLRPLAGETVGYDLCGQGGSDCAVGGAASTVRMLLLRREALELALYTFKYLPESENVVAVLPPGHTTASTKSRKVTVAVLFDRAELAPLLSEPVDVSLAEDPPAVAQLNAWKKSEEAGLVDTVTSRSLFSEQVEAQQDGGNLLILNPLPAS
jgi:hypothetical protein